MSRFYEALRQAGRSGEPATGTPAGEEWDLWGADGNPAGATTTEVPSGEPAASAAAAATASAPIAGHAVDDPWEVARDPQLLRVAAPAPAPEPSATPKPVLKLDRNARLIPNSTSPGVVEQYRRLRTKLIQQHAVKSFRTLIVTSPNPQDGKTVTVVNVGLAFAMLPSFRVLLVDGDLRRGSLGKSFGVSGGPGFSNLIDGSATLDDVLLRFEDSPLHVIPSGNSGRPPAELLQSSNVATVLRSMADRFALVVVDSPPINLVADAHLLANNCDAVLLVARAFTTKRKALEKAARDLSSFRIIGSVLNGGTRPKRYRGYGNY